MRNLAAFVISGALWAAAAPVAAQQAAEGAAAEESKVVVERDKRGRKVFRITGEIVIEGRIQKPNAFYVLDRQSMNYEWTTLKKEFVPRILESVQHPPF